MRPELINPFVSATHATFRQVLAHVSLEWEEPDITSSPVPPGNFVSAIQLQGDINGYIFFIMSEGTAVNLAAAMNNTNLTEINSLAVASIRELINMVAGKAVSYLHEKGVTADISPPMQTDPKELLSGREFLSIPSVSSLGLITVCVAL